MNFENHQPVKVLLSTKLVNAHIVSGRRTDGLDVFTVMLDDGTRAKVTVTEDKLIAD